MINWKNETSYSRLDSNEPTIWAANFGQFRLVVHRHIHYPPDQWLASCSGLFEKIELKPKEVDMAKRQAVAMLKAVIFEALEAMEKP